MHLTDTDKTPFEIVPKDPMQVHICTLENGLSLFFSVNTEEPRIATEIAVRAGSKHDPATSTGLAHYFEHMMFKGTDKLGTLDWAAEKPLLDQIEILYERHRATQDAKEKREIYLEIDKISAQAAKFATANEYDKLLGAMGAKGTNAYTWLEQTVYLNDIPSNELERWFQVESERFRRPVLRLFHTELETVFEEFNISQDKDFRKVSKCIMETLMPSHPYGTQTTLGHGEDLKNPSQKAIYNFFDQHYVPNNMAITLCGDFDVQTAHQLAKKYFGDYAAKPVPAFQFEAQPEFTERQDRTIYGEENEWIEIAWRVPGAAHKDIAALTLLSAVLYNDVAGLIDTHLVQAQKVLSAYSYLRIHEDYSMFIMYGKPRAGQSLTDVEHLLMEQLEQVRSGDFEDWILEGAAKMFKVNELRRLTSNSNRASSITNMYVLGRPWADRVQFLERITQLTKADVQQAAQAWLKSTNFVAVQKLHGKDTNVLKVEKPPITPVEVNRDDLSDFAKAILTQETPPITPEFLDLKRVIRTAQLQKGIKLHVVTEPNEKLATLEWVFPVGKLFNTKLSLAKSYLQYLGTSTMTAAELKRAFFRLGVHLETVVSDRHTILRLSGLDESMPQAAKLVAHLIEDMQPDQNALENLKADIRTRRENNKKNKEVILRSGLKPFATHGMAAIDRFVISDQDLKAIEANELLDILKYACSIEHELHYYGPCNLNKAKKMVADAWHPTVQLFKKPKVEKLVELNMRKNRVLFVHFPMVQVELLQISKGTPRLNVDEYLMERWFNNYFGTSMSSVVFQEIREARAMAYQTYAQAVSPQRKDHAHYFYTFVGTQPDKMAEAISVMSQLVENMPVNAELIEQAKQNTIKVLQANRLPRKNAYWRMKAIEAAGWKEDPLHQVLDYMQAAEQSDLELYHAKCIKNRKYTLVVLGDRTNIDFKTLRKVGKVEELKIEEVLGY